MSDKELYLRLAQKKDCDLLYEWVNDDEVRRNSFDSHIISYEEHCAWFENMMKDPDQLQYILMLEKKPIGQVRLTINNHDADIDYSICSSMRRQGYGKRAIRMVIEQVRTDCPEVVKLIGRIKADNDPSRLCFAENGFLEINKQYVFLINEKA